MTKRYSSACPYSLVVVPERVCLILTVADKRVVEAVSFDNDKVTCPPKCGWIGWFTE